MKDITGDVKMGRVRVLKNDRHYKWRYIMYRNLFFGLLAVTVLFMYVLYANMNTNLELQREVMRNQGITHIVR